MEKQKPRPADRIPIRRVSLSRGRSEAPMLVAIAERGPLKAGIMTILQLAASLSAVSIVLAAFGFWMLKSGRISAVRHIILVIVAVSIPVFCALCLLLVRHIALAGLRT
jgi:hypothetical protein